MREVPTNLDWWPGIGQEWPVGSACLRTGTKGQFERTRHNGLGKCHNPDIAEPLYSGPERFQCCVVFLLAVELRVCCEIPFYPSYDLYI